MRSKNWVIVTNLSLKNDIIKSFWKDGFSDLDSAILYENIKSRKLRIKIGNKYYHVKQRKRLKKRNK